MEDAPWDDVPSDVLCMLRAEPYRNRAEVVQAIRPGLEPDERAYVRRFIEARAEAYVGDRGAGMESHRGELFWQWNEGAAVHVLIGRRHLIFGGSPHG